jgi:hypothetical protein
VELELVPRLLAPDLPTPPCLDCSNEAKNPDYSYCVLCCRAQQLESEYECGVHKVTKKQLKRVVPDCAATITSGIPPAVHLLNSLRDDLSTATTTDQITALASIFFSDHLPPRHLQDVHRMTTLQISVLIRSLCGVQVMALTWMSTVHWRQNHLERPSKFSQLRYSLICY